jgi:hypothetical protein
MGVQYSFDLVEAQQLFFIVDVEVRIDFVVGDKGGGSVFDSARVQLHFFHSFGSKGQEIIQSILNQIYITNVSLMRESSRKFFFNRSGLREATVHSLDFMKDLFSVDWHLNFFFARQKSK